MTIYAYGTYAGDQPLESLTITRREVGAHDVKIEILFCGLCHSDLHQARSEWQGTKYPCVPGHEIVGRVTAIGASVGKYAVGDLVGVGCLVDSCRSCDECRDGLENYCDHSVGTYNGPTPDAPGHTLGGYSQQIIVDENFVLRVRHDASQLAAVAPLLCAGITTWSPLRHWKVGPGSRVGVVGIGGLGHMGLKLAHALGAHVVAFTTSESKRTAALEIGADEVVNSRDPDAMAARRNSLDFILNTVAAPHDLDVFLAMLKRDGTMTLVGAPPTPHPSPRAFSLIGRRRSLSGSLIGGIPETQEMLDFCAEHNITADIEMVRADQLNDAYERMLRGDVKYRFVLDNATLG